MLRKNSLLAAQLRLTNQSPYAILSSVDRHIVAL